MKDYQVKPGSKVNLEDWDPGEHDGEKDEADGKLAELTNKLEDLQEMLYAEHKHKVLIVLQGMDTSGKDGVIQHVFEGVNPQGTRVASFKVPTTLELDHDYLWRIHAQAPGRGEMVIFNRSQYEDVLVVRVHSLVPEEVWKKRYEQINDFERLLADEGTLILKYFLHISNEEQRDRLLARLDDPKKHWKFNPDDLKERELWPAYQQAYAAVLSKTSTEWAPWTIVPSNHKWYRNLVIASSIVSALEGLDMHYPPAADGLEQYKKVLEK